MVYWDTSPKAGVDHTDGVDHIYGVDHTYTVTALSSAGVPSVPSVTSIEMRHLIGKLMRSAPGASDSPNDKSA
jgi:hypothetical protein